MVEKEGSSPKISQENPYYSAVIALVEHASLGQHEEGDLSRMSELAEQDEEFRFGLALKLARRARGFTQRELADKGEVDHSYLSKIEQGKLPPPSRKATLRLAEAIDFPDRTDRLYFMLFAGKAAVEDLKGTEFEQMMEGTL